MFLHGCFSLLYWNWVVAADMPWRRVSFPLQVVKEYYLQMDAMKRGELVVVTDSY